MMTNVWINPVGEFEESVEKLRREKEEKEEEADVRQEGKRENGRTSEGGVEAG